MKLYVASSWRNEHLQQAAVRLLRTVGHEVYDFIHPPGGDHLGFSWSEVDPNWRSWSTDDYRVALKHPIARAGFESDFAGMEWADAGVLLLPCGRSAHLEAGWFAGKGRPLHIVLDEAEFGANTGHGNAELMYSMATHISADLGELIEALG